MNKKARYIINHETMALIPIKDSKTSHIHTLVYEVNQMLEVSEMPETIIESSRHYHQDCNALTNKRIKQALNIDSNYYFPICLKDLQLFIKFEKVKQMNTFNYLSVRHLSKIKKVNDKVVIIFSNNQSRRCSLNVTSIKKRRDMAYAIMILGVGLKNLGIENE